MATIHITEGWLSRTAADGDRPARLPAGEPQLEYHDTQLPGFGVTIGRRFATFWVRRRRNGRREMHTIGRYGAPGAGPDHASPWTVKRAREAAEVFVGTMSLGIDPTPRAARMPTLADAFDAHVEGLRKKVKGGKRSTSTIEAFEKSRGYVEHMLNKPIDEITGEVLVELHDRIKRDARPRANARNEKGAPLANRVITNIGTAWATLNKRLGGKLGNWNPAKSVEKDALIAKRVVLGVDGVADLADWYARVQTMRNPIQRDGLTFALFTGLRSEDVRTVRFEHVDFDARTLRLPDPKGGADRAFTIPLPERCVQILERRRKDNRRELGRDDGDHGWAFPAVGAKGEVGAIGDLREQRHEGGKHWRFPLEDVHTLRRTYTSVAQAAGVSDLDQRVLTNHKFASGDVHEGYVAQHLDHLTSCQEKIAAALEERLKPRPPKPRGKLRSVPSATSVLDLAAAKQDAGRRR